MYINRPIYIGLCNFIYKNNMRAKPTNTYIYIHIYVYT